MRRNAEKEAPVLSINVSEVIWTIICFFTLLFVLKTFLFDPLTRHMDERQSRIDAGREEARRAQEARDEAAAAAEESWRARTGEAEAMLARRKTQDEAARACVLDEAHQQAAQAVREARLRVAQEEAEAREILSREDDRLARELAERLLSGGEQG
ncbi:MAG: ATP synthase F0 subunit B [Ruminococcaceae bacterium]|nr:ATP synthase F0 subunit B [Oscillospiraceae bacterium]